MKTSLRNPSVAYSAVHHATVCPWGFDIDITFEFDPGEPDTWDHPGYAPYAVIEQAVVGGVNIYDMLTNEQFVRLEEHALRAMEV